MALTPLSRRKVVLGTGGVLTYGALAWWSVEYRIRRAEVPLYSETVAFLSPGWRELVPTGHTDTLVPGTRVLAGRPLSTKLVEDELAWLEESAPWVATALDGGDDVLRSALRSPERMASRIRSMWSCSFGGEGVLDGRWRLLARRT